MLGCIRLVFAERLTYEYYTITTIIDVNEGTTQRPLVYP